MVSDFMCSKERNLTMNNKRDSKGQFMTGNKSPMKGRKGVHNSPNTEFKKGVHNNVLSENPNWQGGKINRKDGYVMIKLPTHPNKTKSGYVMEHRAVIEESIGRLLTKGEIVHHIDGNRKNNDIKNLLLLKNKQEHMILHNNQLKSDTLRLSSDEELITELSKRGYSTHGGITDGC